MTQHYHVGVNMPGYLPDSPPTTHFTKREANAALHDLAEEFRNEGVHAAVRGQWRPYYWVRGSVAKGGYEVTPRRDAPGPTYVIWIDPCDGNCFEEED